MHCQSISGPIFVPVDDHKPCLPTQDLPAKKCIVRHGKAPRRTSRMVCLSRKHARDMPQTRLRHQESTSSPPGSLSRNTHHVKRLQDALSSRVVGTRYGMKPHTLWSEILEVAQEASSVSADLLVTLGAGSLTDGAKIIALVSLRSNALGAWRSLTIQANGKRGQNLRGSGCSARRLNKAEEGFAGTIGAHHLHPHVS